MLSERQDRTNAASGRREALWLLQSATPPSGKGLLSIAAQARECLYASRVHLDPVSSTAEWKDWTIFFLFILFFYGSGLACNWCLYPPITCCKWSRTEGRTGPLRPVPSELQPRSRRSRRHRLLTGRSLGGGATLLPQPSKSGQMTCGWGKTLIRLFFFFFSFLKTLFCCKNNIKITGTL